MFGALTQKGLVFEVQVLYASGCTVFRVVEICHLPRVGQGLSQGLNLFLKQLNVI